MTETPSLPKRRRQPELLRRRLLDAAAELAVQGGLQALTVAAVARGAGVTKGGFFHHFPDKETLLTALFDDCLMAFGQLIDRTMTDDRDPAGRFTRAYITATLDPGLAPTAALNAVLLMSPALRETWSTWLRARLLENCETDSGPDLEILRHAADGIWLADLWQLAPDLRSDPVSIRNRLIALTRKDARE